MPLHPEIVVSGDGSHSVISPIFNTLYHSQHGALSEAKVVFIQAGLEYLLEKGYERIKVFEMGFGTGLNAVLTKIWAEQHKVEIIYHTVEAYPVSLDTIRQLNYGALFGHHDDLVALHELNWDDRHTISAHFTFCKWHKRIEELQLEEKFDVVYFDAFAPATQPHLWEEGILAKLYGWLEAGGVLTSFCAQGAFKRNLKKVGFEVQRLPGPPGKREMTRAIKP
ncbi:MAG: tRNA (5-methylaminomethyl-2-thiouridine)(34)-methyltransferase MnmD [Saprospiraceae bacterium]|nr:MAG: 5-methylaminomethyl-2-thiouridine methyltransferase [Bacteroidetes bacterium OLB9]MCO6463096.1 tRNA (5-methylaminomethyl-2-thiouridine)(34)-methyltransferase MnmD [Saprospiraceae bacterium]MCZ2339504.1 tRNA (5-methylaminomethyl-2-thiouridine)(34)-methyltransferase MnmD [Chitinophagales bacterium]